MARAQRDIRRTIFPQKYKRDLIMERTKSTDEGVCWPTAPEVGKVTTRPFRCPLRYTLFRFGHFKVDSFSSPFSSSSPVTVAFGEIPERLWYTRRVITGINDCNRQRDLGSCCKCCFTRITISRCFLSYPPWLYCTLTLLCASSHRHHRNHSPSGA